MKQANIYQIADLKDHVDAEVVIRGWAQTIRSQSKVSFVLVRDITGLIQVVVPSSAPEAFKQLAELTMESVVNVTGKVVKTEQAPGGLEVLASTIEVLSAAHPQLPIQVNEKGEGEAELTKRLDWRWLDLRKPEKQLVFKAWTVMDQAFHDYLIKHKFIQIYSPKLISAASESGAEVFEVNYFDTTAYLAQSPQFYKQMAMASGLERVFEVGPVFRAEPSFTSRHATEFTGYDFEMSYIDSHEDVMAEQEGLLVAMLAAVKQAYGEKIKEHYGKEVVVPNMPFPRISLLEAKELLKQAGVSSEKAHDISPEEERELSRIMEEQHGHEFVFVTDYPIEARPFYHMRHEDNPELTKSYDLLYRGIEISTGAQREHRYEVLVSQAKDKHMELEPIQFYLNFFLYGCPPHGGVGIGPNRIIMQLFDLPSIREAMYLYRGPHRLTP